VGITNSLSGQITISRTELQNIQAQGLIVGFQNSGKDILVEEISFANSYSVTNIATVIGGQDDSLISFSTSPSTFSAVSALADDGIDVEVDLVTTTAGIYLDADLDDSSVDDPNL
jgi:hypothetical protein